MILGVGGRGGEFIKMLPVASWALQTKLNASLFQNYCHFILIMRCLLGNSRGNNKQ